MLAAFAAVVDSPLGVAGTVPAPAAFRMSAATVAPIFPLFNGSFMPAIRLRAPVGSNRTRASARPWIGELHDSPK
jgi:hypothetical protein